MTHPHKEGEGQGVGGSGSIPSAEDIRKVAELFDPKAFEPMIERAAQDIYERILHSCEDYLSDNVEWNIGSHIAMLERENKRMRTELFEVERALGCLSMGQEARLGAIKETQERGNQAANALWELQRDIAAQKTQARAKGSDQ